MLLLIIQQQYYNIFSVYRKWNIYLNLHWQHCFNHQNESLTDSKPIQYINSITPVWIGLNDRLQHKSTRIYNILVSFLTSNKVCTILLKGTRFRGKLFQYQTNRPWHGLSLFERCAKTPSVDWLSGDGNVLCKSHNMQSVFSHIFLNLTCLTRMVSQSAGIIQSFSILWF